MGLFRHVKTIANIANKGLDIADKAVVDKDKIIELKSTIEQIKAKADEASKHMYEVELQEIQGPFINFIRAIQRPLWSTIAAIGFGAELGMFLFNYYRTIVGKTTIPLTVYPTPIHIVMMSVVAFYFGGRFLEKKQKSKFFDKWGL